jgi:hypothetical protein
MLTGGMGGPPIGFRRLINVLPDSVFHPAPTGDDDEPARPLLGTTNAKAWLSLNVPKRLILACIGGSAPRLGLTPALTGTAPAI